MVASALSADHGACQAGGEGSDYETRVLISAGILTRLKVGHLVLLLRVLFFHHKSSNFF